MLRLQNPVPCVDFSSPAACAAPLNRLEPTPMVSTAAPDDLMKLRRLKSIGFRFGRCVHPILSHMVASPLGWIDDCEQAACAHLRTTTKRTSAGRVETNIPQSFGALGVSPVRSSTPILGVSRVAHVTVRDRCNHTYPSEECEHRNLPTVMWHANRCNRRSDAALSSGTASTASVVPTRWHLVAPSSLACVSAADRAICRWL